MSCSINAHNKETRGIFCSVPMFVVPELVQSGIQCIYILASHLFEVLLCFSLTLTLIKIVSKSGTFQAAGGKIEEQLDNGLVMGHAYSITDVIKVSVYDVVIALVPLKCHCCKVITIALLNFVF